MIVSQDPGTARAAQMLAQNPAAFVQALRILDAVAEPSSEQRMARAWMIGAIEAAYPAASDAVAAAYLAAEDSGAEVDYLGVLLQAAGL